MSASQQVLTKDALQTQQLGSNLGFWALRELNGGKREEAIIFALLGDLGAGKTTFVKGMASALGIEDPCAVSSPTFQYLNVYEGCVPLLHFDLYRLVMSEHFEALGFDEYFYQYGVCCIEWAERILDRLPKRTTVVSFRHVEENQREVVVSSM